MTKPISLDHQHSQTVLKAGAIAISVNLLLAIFKIIIGMASNSIAVMSDALHGLVDTASGIIIIISEKLGTSHKFSKDHAQVERIGARLIAIIIIAVGIHIIVESIEKLITPEDVEYSTSIIIVLIASVIAKLLLGHYLRHTGRKVNSDTLTASSVETINDSIISSAVLLSAAVYLIWHIDIEAYVSLIVAAIIIKLGLELFFPKLAHHHHV